MSNWIVSALIMSIPLVILGLVLIVNRKRLTTDFKANPNVWWNACLWLGFLTAFLATLFVGWFGWSMLSYSLFPHSPLEVMCNLVPFLEGGLVVIGFGILFMIIGRKKLVKVS